MDRLYGFDEQTSSNDDAGTPQETVLRASGNATSTTRGQPPAIRPAPSARQLSCDSEASRLTGDWHLVRSTAPQYASGKNASSHGSTSDKVTTLQQQLISASKKGLIKEFNQLIASNININAADHRGKTALHYAAQKGHFWLVAALIDNGAIVGAVTRSGHTALMLAAAAFHGGVVELLLCYDGKGQGETRDDASSLKSARRDLNLFNESATTISFMPQSDRTEALLKAVADARVDAAARMIASGNLDMEEHDLKGMTLLAQAARMGAVDMIRLLLCAGARMEAPDLDGNTPLMQAVKFLQPLAIAALLQEGANTSCTNKAGESLLMLAMRTDNHAVVQCFLSNKVDIWRIHDGTPGFIAMAASEGRTALVRGLMKVGADVRDKDGSLALTTSAKDGDLTAVIALLDAGADPMDKCDDGHTAFTLAAANGHIPVVKTLLASSPSSRMADALTASISPSSATTLDTPRRDSAWVQKLLGQTDTHGRSALMLAVMNKKFAMAELLLKEKPDLHKTDHAGCNAWLWAAARADGAMLQLLKDYQVSHVHLDKHGNNALMTAARNNNFDTATVLCRPIYQIGNCHINMPNREGDTALIEAARHGSIDMVKLLLGAGANIFHHNNLGRTAMFEAASYGHTDVFILLQTRLMTAPPVYSSVDYSIKMITDFIAIARPLMPAVRPMQARTIDSGGNSMLHMASLNGQTDMVRYLMNANGQAAAPTQTHLIAVDEEQSAAIGQAMTISIMSATVDIEGKNKHGLTPLSMAVSKGNLATAELLLKAGANANHLGEGGVTPLWLACGLKSHRPAIGATYAKNAHIPIPEQIVDLLLGFGAHAGRPSYEGQTPLIAAAAGGCLGMVDKLLDRGADIGKACNNGHTPIMYAAWFGHVDVVLALLNVGAAVNSKNRLPSALTFAATRGHDSLVLLLLSRGANIDHIGPDRSTAIIAACKAGKLSTVKLLITKRAGLHQFDDDYCDALHYAKKSGDLAMIEAFEAGYPAPRDQ